MKRLIVCASLIAVAMGCGLSEREQELCPTMVLRTCVREHQDGCGGLKTCYVCEPTAGVQN